MKDREIRHQTIRRIVRSHHIESQEALAKKMEEGGFIVNQATLSRDLNHLMVAKISDGSGGYYYALPGEDQPREPEGTYIQDLLRGWISLAFSANIGVVKTLPGHADSVAIALDNLHIDGILGTVAGDDAIIVVLREDTQRESVVDQLTQRVPQLAELLPKGGST